MLDIKPPAGVVLAADYQYNQVPELEGDVQAMRLVDLEREGLTEYRAQLQRMGINYLGPAGIAAELNALTSQSNNVLNTTSAHVYANSNTNPLVSQSNVNSTFNGSTAYSQVFSQPTTSLQSYATGGPAMVASQNQYTSCNYGVGQAPAYHQSIYPSKLILKSQNMLKFMNFLVLYDKILKLIDIF